MSYLRVLLGPDWLWANIQSLEEMLLLFWLYWFEETIWIAGFLSQWRQSGGHSCCLGARLWSSVEISKKEVALHIVGNWCVCGGCICVGRHLFGIWLGNQFYFPWKPVFKVPYIDCLWAIVTLYSYSSLLSVISNEAMAVDVSMIRKICGGSPLSFIIRDGHSNQCG